MNALKNVLRLTPTVLLAVFTLVSASGKLAGMEQVEALLDSVQVFGALRQALPFIQIAGGLGALVGLAVERRLAIAASAGLTLYYATAVALHLRAGADDWGLAAGYAVLGLVSTGLLTATRPR